MKRNLITLVLIIISFGIFAQSSTYAPSLTAPVNGAVKQMPNVLLQWGPVPGAMTYKVQADTDSLFSGPQKIATIYAATKATELFFGKKYFWRVKAIGISDSSAWSSVGNFYTIDTVKVLKPTNGSLKQKVSCFMKWNAITGLTDYEYEVDTNLSFSSPLYNMGSFSGISTYGYSFQLAIGKTYYLRMRAKHSMDVSSWCNPIQFRTKDTTILKRPLNDTIAKHPVTSLQWKQIGSTHYDYSISTDTNFTAEIIYPVDSNSFVYMQTDSIVKIYTDTLQFNTKYFWRVRARNSIDTSKWTDSWKFTTIQYIKTLKPVNDSVGVSTVAKFEWQKTAGIRKYILEVDTSIAFLTPKTFTCGGSLVQYQIPLAQQLQNLKSYYWRMKAINSVDTSDWSPVKHFTTGQGTSVEKNTINNQVNIYPNPARDYLFIEINNDAEGTARISVLNMVGQEVVSESMQLGAGNNLKQINTSLLSNGVYFIKINNNGSIITRKMVIDK
jgi:hypothetical protein